VYGTLPGRPRTSGRVLSRSRPAPDSTRPPEPTARPFAPAERRSLNLESAATNAFRQLSGSSVVIPTLLALGATPFHVGLLGASPYLARSAQLFVAARLGRRGARSVALVAGTAERLLFVLVAIAPFWLHGYAAAASVLLCGILAAHLCAETFNASVTSWHVARVPSGKLGGFNATRSCWGQAAAFAALLSVAAGVGALPDAGASRADWLGVIMLVGCACGLAGIFLLRRVPALSEPVARCEERTAREVIRTVLKDRAFRSLLAYNACFGFATHLASPFFLAYALQGLGFSAGGIALLSAVGLGTGALMLPLWGRVTDRFGNRPVLLGCGAWAAMVPLLWVAIAHESTPYSVFAIEALSGAAWAGINLASSTTLSKIAPRDHRRLAYVGVFTALSGSIVGLAPLLGGALIGGLIPLVGLTAAYKGVFALSGVLRLLALFRLRNVVEHRSRTLAHSARALGRSSAHLGSPAGVAAALLWVPAAADGLRREALQRAAPRWPRQSSLPTLRARTPVVATPALPLSA
jgi:Na+/melibiose symporter-like transporter